MNKKILSILLTALICIITIAPAIAQPPTPFVIDGYVFYANGTACNDPNVNVTNTNTSGGWYAENASSSNYYQLVLANGTDLNATEILRFNVTSPDGSQSKIVEHTVTQAGVNDGGFSEDITFVDITSCNGTGAEQNAFCPGEKVYVKGCGLESDTDYKIWIQNDPVGEGYTLTADNCTSYSGMNLSTNVTTNASGCFEPTEIWNISASAPITHNEYDIVVDKQGDGANTGKYNAASDGIDDANVAGIVAPVPELPTILLSGLGLLVIAGYVGLRRKMSR
jgi:hypothetical protein